MESMDWQEAAVGSASRFGSSRCSTTGESAEPDGSADRPVQTSLQERSCVSMGAGDSFPDASPCPQQMPTFVIADWFDFPSSALAPWQSMAHRAAAKLGNAPSHTTMASVMPRRRMDRKMPTFDTIPL